MIQRWSRAVRRGFAFGVLLIVSLSAHALAGTPPAVVAKLSNPGPLVQRDQIELPPLAPGDQYGKILLSADGRTLLVEVLGGDCPANPDCGAVDVFTRRFGTWTREARLTASDGTPVDVFGRSLALTPEGRTVLIGASSKDCAKGPDCGAAYVFTRAADGTWSEQQKLLPSDVDALSAFGTGAALSADGTKALIGAFGTRCANGFSGCGAVYEFTWNGASWIETGKITAPFRFADQGFGSSVVLSRDGQTLLVEENVFGFTPGSVYVFQRSGGSWTQEARIDAPGACEVFFGEEMSLSDDGETAVIACSGANDHAYVYTRQGGTWPQQAELIPAGGFSGSVGLSGDGNEVILGLRRGECTTSAVASIFTRNGGTWSEGPPLLAQNPTTGSTRVDLSGDALTAVVGPVQACTGPAPASNPYVVLVFGPEGFTPDVPALSGLGLLLLAMILAACGAALLVRRRGQA